MAKRQTEDMVAYVHALSPQKKNKVFNLRIQTQNSKSLVRAICFDGDKHEKLTQAKLLGQPIKLQKIIKQTETAEANYASLLINKETQVDLLETANVKFKRIEPEHHYIDLTDDPVVGELVAVKAKIDLSHGKEKTVNFNLKATKVLNKGIIYDEHGSMELTLWEEWIDWIKDNVTNGHDYFNCKNLLVREFNNVKYLSTCSDSDITVMDEDAPDVSYIENDEVS